MVGAAVDRATDTDAATDAATDADTDAGTDARTVDVLTWGDSSRSAAVGAGPAALLHLPENFNPGWVAEVDGERLQALRVDGWQQAWVLPEGGAVEVQLTYAPQRVYRVLLPLGLGVSGLLLLGALGLLIAGALGRRRPLRRHVDAPVPATEPGWPAPVTAPLSGVVAGRAGARRAAVPRHGRCARARPGPPGRCSVRPAPCWSSARRGCGCDRGVGVRRCRRRSGLDPRCR